MTVQIIVSPSGDELLVLPRADHAALLARAIEGGAPAEEGARAQIITPGNEELAVLSRRDHDVLLAWAGDEDADDRLVAEWARRELASPDQAGDPEPMSEERLRRAEAVYAAKIVGGSDDRS
jgi:hypothetical protein